MAQRSSSGRGAAVIKERPGNQTPGTPRIRESEIAQMRVDEIRGELKKRGVAGISRRRKDELVRTLAQVMRAEQRKRRTAKTETGKGPSVAKKAPATRKTSSTAKAPAAKKAAAGRKIAAATRSAGGGTARQGRSSSRSLKYAQRISSPQERPSHPGRSLVTTNHQVIQQWAEARGATPATISGTERGDRPGVLRLDFPGYGSSSRMRRISWDEWFRTFDERGLNFIYQEQQSNGRKSNFFVLESPEREDG